jgi:cellulose synthase/poly-beta-1,6-N-acetylglucosamine synthase-like glycosyltransferase
MPPAEESVLVSILLAARNEEANIERCLRSLDALEYPVENIEICIGDDDSTDGTAAIVTAFISGKPQFKYFKINHIIPGLKGKANVLAQLAREAKGNLFFFCDADIAVNPAWIDTMHSHFQQNTGIVVGLTRMKKSHLLADFLSLEWLFTLTIFRFASLFKIPVTGMGNNMAVTRKAYEAVGGYEKLEFSIVEDYALFMAIVEKGFAFKMAYNLKLLSWSEPVNSIQELIVQRKRWMMGVMQSPLITKIPVITSAFVIPFLIILGFWRPQLAGLLLLTHYLVMTAIAATSIILLRQKDLWKIVFFFCFYMFINTTVMLYNYFKH